jgi:hypothetical protein
MKNKKRKSRKSKPNPVGRPPLYKSAEELQTQIRKYFNTEAYIDLGFTGKGKNRKRLQKYAPTISGLVLYCGFCNRASFYDLESNPEFTNTIKKARTMIEQYYERLLHGANCTGAIFALKNFGWQDKTELEHTGEIKFTQMPAIKVSGKSLEIKIG